VVDPNAEARTHEGNPGFASAGSTTASLGAGDRTRTGDVQLGKLAFYQLNYARDPARAGASNIPAPRHAYKTNRDSPHACFSMHSGTT
jgi:hypothetical protein